MSQQGEGRLGRWSRVKRKRAAGEDVKEPDGQSDDQVYVEPRRGAAAPVAEDVGPDRVVLRNGKPYLPPLAGEEDEDDAGDRAGATAAAGLASDAAVDDEEPAARPLTDEEKKVVDALPRIDDLTKDSDFTPFMNSRVPEFIRRRALRKLWRLDPVFGFLDRMNEYDEDYTIAVELAAGASDYRPDQGGYAWKDRPKPKDEEDAETAESGGDGAVAAKRDGEGEGDEDYEASIADKARRVQNRGATSVRAPEYTANPYYQAPGMRDPIPAEIEKLPRDTGDAVARPGDGDDLGDAEDDIG
ncbi:MAG: DUF3306 domain-containing protein [Rhodospirillaceae bacterium]